MLALTALGLVPLAWVASLDGMETAGNRAAALCCFRQESCMAAVLLILLRDADRADLDGRVSSAAGLSQSSGARVRSYASERSALQFPAVLSCRLGPVSLSWNGRGAGRAGARLSDRNRGARISQPVRSSRCRLRRGSSFARRSPGRSSPRCGRCCWGTTYFF